VAGSRSDDDMVDLAREEEEEGTMRVLSSGVRRLRLHLPPEDGEREWRAWFCRLQDHDRVMVGSEGRRLLHHRRLQQRRRGCGRRGVGGEDTAALARLPRGWGFG
jgi:hypothetical protein